VTSLVTAYASWAHNYLKLKEAINTKAIQVNKQKCEVLDNLSLILINNDKDENDVVAQSLKANPTQNVSVFKPAHILPGPTLVSMQVSLLHIS
jgi:hypothetical protein